MKTVKLASARNGQSAVVTRSSRLADDPKMKKVLMELQEARHDFNKSIAEKVQWVWALSIEIDSRVVGIGFIDDQLCHVVLNTRSESKVTPVTLAQASEIMLALDACHGVDALGYCDIETSFEGWRKHLEMIAKV